MIKRLKLKPYQVQEVTLRFHLSIKKSGLSSNTHVKIYIGFKVYYRVWVDSHDYSYMLQKLSSMCGSWKELKNIFSTTKHSKVVL